MEKRICGKSGIGLSAMGLGCWSYGGGDYWGPQSQQDVDAVAQAALDHGINFFDTAEGYNDGRSEEALGNALKGRRHEAKIGTKISANNTEPTVLREHCEASLRRLQTDYIDIYMVHWPIAEHSVADAFATLNALKAEGKIRSIGVSNFGVQQLSEALATGVQIDVNQLCYNLLSRAIEVEILPLCLEHEIGIFGYMPLMQGILTGIYRTADEIPHVHARFRHFRGDRPRAGHGEAGAEAEMFEAIDGIRALAASEGIPMSRLALAWAMAKPGITCVLVGTRNLSELHENVQVTGLSLSAEMIGQLDALTEPLLQKLGSNADYFLAKRTR
ncbi:MAG: aldo/keto reductase [Candidatus Poribacteria bacterium]|nr:aldo/keto reductase [Candidatus Poribacteria bacterium]